MFISNIITKEMIATHSIRLLTHKPHQNHNALIFQPTTLCRRTFAVWPKAIKLYVQQDRDLICLPASRWDCGEPWRHITCESKNKVMMKSFHSISNKCHRQFVLNILNLRRWFWHPHYSQQLLSATSSNMFFSVTTLSIITDDIWS